MKQVAFVSGKGGTGKSTLVSSLSMLINNKMIADCDVDAPNLHILLKGNILEEKDFYGAKEAKIDTQKCIKCEKCIDVCRFNAISKDLDIISYKCEGCGACIQVCSYDAISLNTVKTGKTYMTETDQGVFSHALLDAGAEGSGKLVTDVRKNIESYKTNEDYVLIDGSPGIGCVVIASITGADAVVVVSEPTMSGLSDLKRVLSTARHFEIPSFVCINKYDLNFNLTRQIESYCEENGYLVVGKVPFDSSIVKALQKFKTPVETGNARITKEILNIWINLKKYL